MQLRLDEDVGVPIPPNSRDPFGMWLSGFVDGEGCFQINRRKHGLAPCGFAWVLVFSLGLRADDIGILYEVQRFWNTGCVSTEHPHLNGYRANPSAVYRVGSLKQHREVIVPHFLRYPLRAKKARDFEIWREAVRFASEVGARQAIAKAGRRTGMVAKWQQADHEYMEHLRRTSRERRKFDGDLERLPGPPPIFRLEASAVSAHLPGDSAGASTRDLVVTAPG